MHVLTAKSRGKKKRKLRLRPQLTRGSKRLGERLRAALLASPAIVFFFFPFFSLHLCPSRHLCDYVYQVQRSSLQ
jgi:hypothetical protein